MADDLTFGVRLDGDSGSLVSQTQAATVKIVELKQATDDLAAASSKMAAGSTTDWAALQRALNDAAVAEDNARDKAWALANGYKEINGQLVKTKEVAEEAAGANAGVTRSLTTLGREAVSGNFAQMPGTLAVLASRAGLTGAEMVKLGISIGAPVTALGALAIAIYQGVKEMEAMDNALAITSNYAGLTRGGMEQLAAAMASTGQITIGTSKDVVTQLVASGRIGADAIGAVANLASDFARTTGQDIEKITPQLVKLFSDPLKGAEELNKSMHFLNATEIEYIATLERQGDTRQAQLFLADKLQEHLPKETENVGYLTSAYRGLRNVIADVVDAAENLGKTDSVERQMQILTNRIANMKLGGAGDNNPVIKSLQAEALALADVYVAQEKKFTAQKESNAESEKELLVSKEIQKTKTYKIDELKATLQMLEAAKQTNLVIEREKEIREQIASLQKVKPDTKAGQLAAQLASQEAYFAKLEVMANQSDASALEREDRRYAEQNIEFQKFMQAAQRNHALSAAEIEQFQAGINNILVAHQNKRAEIYQKEWAANVKLTEANIAEGVKRNASEEKQLAQETIRDQKRVAAQAKRLATQLANENAYFAKIAVAAAKSDSSAAAREQARYEKDLIDFEARYAQALLEHDFMLGEQEAFETARDNIELRHNEIRKQIGLAAFEEQLSAAGTQYRTFFELNKAYKTVKAVIAGYEAVQESYAWGASWGGPVGGAAAAALAVAATAANVAAIQGASFGGGKGLSGAGGGSGGAAITTPSPLAPSAQRVSAFANTALTAAAAPTPVQQINVTIIGSKNNPDLPLLSYNSFVNDVIPLMQQAKSNGHLVDFNVRAA